MRDAAPQMAGQHPHIRAANAADAELVRTALASAFDDDPVLNFFVRQDAERAHAIGLVMQRSFEMFSPLDEMFVEADGGGAALWAPPGRWQMSLLEELLLLPHFVRACTLSRLGRLVLGFETIKRHHPRAPHHYLFMLGAHRDRQGQGVGSALLAPVLARCDAENLPAYLENSKATNLPFYRRHGFEVTKTFRFGPGGPEMWGMRRAPRGTVG
jgi:ribosomal protein S18 acetylase RimI-like enzyme